MAPLLEAVDACDDVQRLRTALKVLATAIPDLMVSTEPVGPVLATTLDAVVGTWP